MIYSTGIDIVSIKRLKELVNDNTFLDRVLTHSERQYIFTKRHPYKHLSGRFAAKEAVMKAFGTGWNEGIGWKDIEIINAPDGKPIVQLHSNAHAIAQGKKTFLSISYAKDIAIALAVIEV